MEFPKPNLEYIKFMMMMMTMKKLVQEVGLILSTSNTLYPAYPYPPNVDENY